MKLMKFLLTGILFGIVMTKSEAISWFRIQEMFRFESFHMYGIIGTAVVLGAIMIALIKKTRGKTINGEPIAFSPKDSSIARYLFGGILFGLGWAMTGACPGPLFTLLGHGIWSILIVIISAVFGTYLYGVFRTVSSKKGSKTQLLFAGSSIIFQEEIKTPQLIFSSFVQIPLL